MVVGRSSSGTHSASFPILHPGYDPPPSLATHHHHRSRADVMLCWVKKVSPAHASSSSAGFRMARLRASVAWHKKDGKNIHYPTAWHARPCRQPSRTSSSQPPRLCTRPILSAIDAPKHEPARTIAMFSTPYTVKFSSCPALVLKPRHYSALGGNHLGFPARGVFNEFIHKYTSPSVAKVELTYTGA